MLAVLTAFVSPAVPASASSDTARPQAAPHLARLADGRGARLQFPQNGSVCQDNTIECLNLTLCNTTKGVQLWNAVTEVISAK
jgi:hypothetical protein